MPALLCSDRRCDRGRLLRACCSTLCVTTLGLVFLMCLTFSTFSPMVLIPRRPWGTSSGHVVFGQALIFFVMSAVECTEVQRLASYCMWKAFDHGIGQHGESALQRSHRVTVPHCRRDRAGLHEFSTTYLPREVVAEYC